jgi:hypothetical protein
VVSIISRSNDGYRMPRLVIDSGSLPIRQAFELCNFHKAALGKSDRQLLKPGDYTF